MKNQWRLTGFAVILTAVILLAGCFAPVLSAAEADTGYAGKWIVDEIISGGETTHPSGYDMEMSIELMADGTAFAHLGTDGTGTWFAEGNQIVITIEGDTANATIENGVMILPLGEDVSMKLVKDSGSAAIQSTKPESTEVPAARSLDADETAYVGEWHLIFLGTGGFAGNASDIGLTGETLTMNADHTSVLTLDPDQPARKWLLEDGIVRLDNDQRLILLREDILQYGTEKSGYMIFSKDSAMVWDGSILLYDPFTETTPEATEVPTVPNEAPANQESRDVQTEVKYTATTYIANGAEMDASVLGAEYSVILHDGGTVDCVLDGTAIPGLLWKKDGDATVIDYYGNGEIRIMPDENGILLDFLGTMILKMVP